MKQEKDKSLNEKRFDCNVSIGFDDDIQDVIFTKDVKHHILKAEKKLKQLSDNEWRYNHWSEIQMFIEEIFKEEFGELAGEEDE